MVRKKLIGMVLIVCTLISLGMWELWGREKLIYDKVLVLKNNVEKGQAIEKKNLEEKLVENPNEKSIKATEFKEIIGKEASHFIPKDTEIFREYFKEPDFNVEGNENKMVFAVPDEWILSCPSTIKRGDRAIFYYKGKIVAECYVIHVRDGSNQEVNYLDSNRLQATSKVVSVEVVADFSAIQKLKEITKGQEQVIIMYR